VVSTGAQRRIVWVSAPGDYATFNSNHTPDGTGRHNRQAQAKIVRDNDLCLFFKRSRHLGQRLREFIEENRETVEAAINAKEHPR
jgi:hypothetical protein